MRRRAFVVFWVLMSAVLLYVLVPIFWKVSQLRRDEARLSEEVRLLKMKNQVLENKLRLIQEDPVYVEYLARKKFRKAKEGEVIYRLVPREELEGQDRKE